MASKAMSFRNAILFGSIVLAFFGISAAVGLILTSSYLHGAAQSMKEAVDSIVASEELHVDLLEHNRQQLLFDYTGDAVHARRRDAAEQRLNRGVEALGLYVNTDVERELVVEVKTLVAQYLAQQAENDAGQVPLKDFLADSVMLNDITGRIRGLIQLNQDQARLINDRVARQDRLADMLGFSVIIVLLMSMVVLIYGARAVIYKPLVFLQDTVKRFGKGDFKVRTVPSGPLELREVATVFNEMADNLENSYRSQNRFLAAVAHDLRNPIGAIKMSMDVIASTRAGLSSEIHEITEIVRRQSDQLNQMVGDLLDRTRIEAGELVLHREEQDLRPFAVQAVRLYQSVSKMHGLQLELPDEPVLCFCDSTRIGQVLNNLLSNAIKYSPYGGLVRVKVLQDAHEATILVTDQGMGIPEEDRERIFEPFRRSKTTQDTIPGVGLGLFASRQLMEAHGGRIHVTSEVGKGSTFTLHLPLADVRRDGSVKMGSEEAQRT